MMRKEIAELSEKYKKSFEDCSDEIWATPEINFTEHKSHAAALKVMTELGFEISMLPDMDTAFVATAGSGKPVIGILGELDALPGLSQNADVDHLDPVQTGCPGHGCGHNLLGCGGMETAYILKKYFEEHGIEGTIKYFSCPAEEGGVGKVYMIHRGAFDDVDFCVNWHPGTGFGITHDGKSILISNYRFRGVASHAAGNPEKGRSALDALEIMNVGLQFLREHMAKETFIHYAITNTGGFAANVVQAYAEGQYVIRAKDNTELKKMAERVKKVAQGAAWMTETEVEGPEIVSAFSSFIDNTTLADVARENIKECMPIQYTEEELEYLKKFTAVGGTPEETNMASTEIHEDRPTSSDVADVSWVVPTMMISVPTWAPGTPGHSWNVTAQGKSSVAHKGMNLAAQIMANVALDMLEKPELIEKAKEELKTNLKGRTYATECFIPKDKKPVPIY
ncbi:MAG: amidohydrolase [Firmicutes bacterium]|nr:amidohydrolase [Bacillota bacterium]